MGFGSALKSIVGKIAPTVGTALGGPVGGIASKFLADKLLGKPEATDQEIEDYILTATPEKMLELKKLDLEFASSMRKLDIDVYKLEVEDRRSARDLFKVNMWPQIVLSAIFVIGYFLLLRFIMIGKVSIGSGDEFLKGVVVTIIGVITAAVPQILNFWFGSSMGSKEKAKELTANSRK